MHNFVAGLLLPPEGRPQASVDHTVCHQNSEGNHQQRENYSPGSHPALGGFHLKMILDCCEIGWMLSEMGWEGSNWMLAGKEWR